MSFLQNLVTSLKSQVTILEDALAANNINPPSTWPNSADPTGNGEIMPWPAFTAMEKIRTDLRALDAAVTPPSYKLLELGMMPLKTSALSFAVSTKISNIIEELQESATIDELCRRLNVNENKLSRVLRLLATDHIYHEVSPGRFKNTKLGLALTSPNAAQFMSLLSKEHLQTTTGLASNLQDPKTAHSFADKDAPFCQTLSTDGKTFFEYMADPDHLDMAMKVIEGVVPWLNQVTRPALLQDYPWQDLGSVRVVDVGCGPGDSGFDIIRQCPTLKWTFQDLPPAIEQLKTNFPPDLESKLADGSITCIAQDYFEENASDGEVWYLRGVAREYDDDELIKVLSRISTAMKRTPGSRILINEILVGSPSVGPAEAGTSSGPPSDHIPPNQSRLTDVASLMTWNTYCFFGGKERSLEETQRVMEKSGLRLTKFFPFRSFTCMIEGEAA